MSIATRRGDQGETSLIGNTRISKSAPRVEAYGTVDELISVMGFARSVCDDEEVRTRTKEIQRELFAVNSALAALAEKPTPDVTAEMIDRLTGDVHRIEALEGVIGDWTLPGEHAAAAAYDVARTVCRRAERAVIRLGQNEHVPSEVIAYLNRLSDLLWLFGRILEVRAGVDASMRGPEHGKARWSRAW